MAGKKSPFARYIPVLGVSQKAQIVSFLLYAREHAPNVFVSHAEVTQRIKGYPKAPNPKSLEVDSVRGAMSGVRNALMEDHQCGLDTDPIYGVRATTDTADLLKTQMVKVARRFKGQQAMFTRTADLIDPRKIPNTPEYKGLKTWFNTSVQPVVKAISSTDFAAKLLPPKREEE